MSLVSIESQQSRICDLVHLQYLLDDSDSPLFQLTRRNALTLQSLVITCERKTDIGLLIQDADGNGTTYPQLSRLRVSAMYIGDDGLRTQAFHDVVPFPRLCHLHFHTSYPFVDDVVFRGNAATLESLLLNLDTGFDNADDCLRFVLDIGPGASVCGIRESDGNELNLLPALPAFATYLPIQVLELFHFNLDLWQTIGLVQSLPLLSDIHTGLPNLGSLPEGIALDKLPAHMVSTYTSIGERFQCWDILHIGRQEEDTVTCMLSVALVCPNFDSVATPRGYRCVLSDAMMKRIEEPAYSPYASRLQRLLVSERPGFETMGLRLDVYT
ncbi:hypothetical protein GGI20_002859 [Coemansia sp. BCRC 34301]|nr:hypothetical protein GGI20_002859 [Coemansia sp. BCRC 34301]